LQEASRKIVETYLDKQKKKQNKIPKIGNKSEITSCSQYLLHIFKVALKQQLLLLNLSVNVKKK